MATKTVTSPADVLATPQASDPTADAQLTQVSQHWGKHERTVLVIQGGGALGAYQAGVYTGLVENGLAVDWVAGVSIGAINASLIAGNPPERRLERLREFWERMSAPAPVTLPAMLGLWRPLINRAHAASAALFGVPGFFAPRPLPPALAPEGSMAAVSYYDTQPLKATLEQLVDFDYVNQKHVRLSLGAANVSNGKSMYFDNTRMRIGPEHVMASSALPPAFPPVEIDGELYWDGGIVSNSPLTYVMDEAYRSDALIFQIDLFSGVGAAPRNLDQVIERHKDIQYASKQRVNISRVQEFEELRAALGRVIDQLPDTLQSDPDVHKLKTISTRGKLTLVHFVNQHNTSSSYFKDCEFSRTTVSELWNAGQHDVRDAMSRPELRQAMDLGHGMRIYDATR
jgi:NTE family protein